LREDEVVKNQPDSATVTKDLASHICIMYQHLKRFCLLRLFKKGIELSAVVSLPIEFRVNMTTVCSNTTEKRRIKNGWMKLLNEQSPLQDATKNGLGPFLVPYEFFCFRAIAHNTWKQMQYCFCRLTFAVFLPILLANGTNRCAFRSTSFAILQFKNAAYTEPEVSVRLIMI
jgi:hypothetical protein